MYWDLEVTAEDEEQLIYKTAKKIHEYGMETAAILFLESLKPLAYIGGQMGRFFISPYLPVIGEEIGITGEKLMRIFENRENVEKLITILEEMARGEYKQPKELKEAEDKSDESQLEEPASRDEKEEKKKEGWRRYLPF